LAGFETKLDSKEQKLSECKKKLKRTAAREKYNASKVRILEQSLNEECCTESRDRFAFLENQLKEKEREIAELQVSVHYIEDLVNDNQSENGMVMLFDERSKIYSSKLKQCVYAILNLQVNASKVSPVIQTVLRLQSLAASTWDMILVEHDGY